MGKKYQHWKKSSSSIPKDFSSLKNILHENRNFTPQTTLHYGDHGLQRVACAIVKAIKSDKRIGLYADYDVDGTMSCVAWIWFLRAIAYKNFVHYIPCRFKEGYGLNLEAIDRLITKEKVDLIVTMDTGITARAEADFCRQKGVEFICTDHHVIQKDKVPDALILNPKMHPDPDYQELCGCGITFILLRQVGKHFNVPKQLWTDLLALAGMATICDIVPLNGVNHRLARLGVLALMHSDRAILKKMRRACAAQGKLDEKDVGFRLGPRINAVGRLEHADIIVRAFLDEDPSALIEFMHLCNERRKDIQETIVQEARKLAEEQKQAPLIFLGGDWHPGVVGIAASKIVDEFWKPVWLFQRKEGMCKGSARSIAGFNVTQAMEEVKNYFLKFGGHANAGGFSFSQEHEDIIRKELFLNANKIKEKNPEVWESQISYDCELSWDMLHLGLMDVLDGMKPFGHAFAEPRFGIRAKLSATRHYLDKKTGKKRHTALVLKHPDGGDIKVMFFNQVLSDLNHAVNLDLIVCAQRNTFRSKESLSLIGCDYSIVNA